jgi:non-ribosomal peptide synthetase component F
MARPADYAFRQPAAGDAAHDPADVAAPTDSLAPVDPNSGDARDHERTVFPCSVAQERFWLLDRLDPGNASYNVAVRWRLEGRVDTELLERTWLLIIERHEILRTVFEEANGVAVQRVCPTCAFKLAEIDLQALPPDEQGAEGDRIGGLEARAPFDLGSGPILRATLLRFSPTVSIILVTIHQIVSDGWSIGVMAREMGIIYEALSHERPVPLEELAIQYADYSLWQLEWLRVRGTDAETAYWTRQLAGVKPFKVVPDRPRPALPTTRGVIVSRVLPRTVTDRAQAFSADRGATLFASVLATLCAVLARFTGEREILLGTQVSDRDQVELEPMVGQFVNSLILRNDVSDDPRFCDLVDRVGETTSQALEHRHIPIERLLGMVKGEHSHANSAPISVNFIFQKTFIRNTSYSDFTLIDMPSLPAGAIYDLNMFMVERPDGWRFSCQYNTDQFERDTAERLLRYVEQAMHSAMARPECRVSELQLSDPREAEDLLRQLHGARVPLPAMSVPESFAMQVMNRTDAIAVVHGSRTLRYVELDAAASRLAARLRELGLPRGATVGLSLENGIAWPVALLGILKAGFVAALIDSGTAAALRSAQIAASGCAAIVVADGAEIGAEIPRVDPVPLLEPASPRMTFDAPQVGTDQPACRLPVSGSNATQYVSLSHGNLVHLAFSLARRLQLGERDVFFGGMVQAPDRTIAETLAALLGGARIVIAEARQRGDWAHLADSLRRSEATVMYAEAPTWAGLLDAGWTPTAGFRMLHDLTQFGAPLADRLAATNGELWGLYGLTRAGIWSTAGRRRPREAARSIGTPLDHVQLQVIDSSGQQAVVGATGVLRIDSEGTGTPQVHRVDRAAGTEHCQHGATGLAHRGRRSRCTAARRRPGQVSRARSDAIAAG